MKIFLSILFLFVCVSKLNGQEDVDVILSQMNASMQKYAVGETLVLLSDNEDFESVAASLIENMNKRYGKDWVVLIGTNLHPLVIGMTVVNNTYLLLGYKNNHVLMFKQLSQNTTTTQTNVQDLIERARKAPVNSIQTTDGSTFGRITSLAQQVLQKDYASCDSNTNSVDINHWCYKELSTALIDVINNGTVGDGVYTATVGNSNRCFSYTLGLNITEAHIFKLDDIYFEVRKYHL